MTERLPALGAILGAKILAYYIKKRREKKKKREEKKTAEAPPPPPPTTTEKYDNAMAYIFEKAAEELGLKDLSRPTYGSEAARSPLSPDWYLLAYFTHPELKDLEKWKEFVKKHSIFSATEGWGTLHALPFFSGPTAIILTKDGRLFHLPQGENAFEIATNTWEPLFQYLEKRARKKAVEKGISLRAALNKVIEELGLTSTLSDVKDYDPVKQAEIAIYDKDEPPEKKKQILKTIKKIYIDELGLPWMPLPLVHSDLHRRQKSHFQPSNQVYIEAIPEILKEMGGNPQDPLLQKRIQALKGILYKIHWPEYWEARTALALAEALHQEGKITDQEYIEILEHAARGEEKQLIEKAKKLAEKHTPQEEEKEEEKPSGAKILAHPDRYPTLTQKILLKTLVLGQLQKENRGIDRNLYRALRNLLTGPETTHNFYPLILEWLERIERGEKLSPIRLIIEKLPLPPHIKGTILAYAKQIEQGTPINQIPEKEKQAFKQAIEQAKQEIWKNPEKYKKNLTKIISPPTLGEDHSKKTLIGILDDLAKIYTGEKQIADLDIERDALQVLRLIKNLEDKNQTIDPYEISEKIRETINQHIQDPLLRKAYNEVIDHYQTTSHQIPRNQQYLEKIIEEERKLEEKLTQLQHEERKLTKNQIRRLRNLYRMLNLLTPHPTLRETKQFYTQLFQNKKIKVGSEEFYPAHGPLIPNIVEDFGVLRKTGEKEYREKALQIASSYEPLLFIGPLLQREVENVLIQNQEKLIPLEEHNRFINTLEKIQIRRPASIKE